MLKDKGKDEDPYAEVRRPIAPPGIKIGRGKEYDKNKHRKGEKGLILKELEEIGDELDDNIEIL